MGNRMPNISEMLKFHAKPHANDPETFEHIIDLAKQLDIEVPAKPEDAIEKIAMSTHYNKAESDGFLKGALGGGAVGVKVGSAALACSLNPLVNAIEDTYDFYRPFFNLSLTIRSIIALPLIGLVTGIFANGVIVSKQKKHIADQLAEDVISYVKNNQQLFKANGKMIVRQAKDNMKETSNHLPSLGSMGH